MHPMGNFNPIQTTMASSAVDDCIMPPLQTDEPWMRLLDRDRLWRLAVRSRDVAIIFKTSNVARVDRPGAVAAFQTVASVALTFASLGESDQINCFKWWYDLLLIPDFKICSICTRYRASSA